MQGQKRWGILSLAVVMFLITLMLNPLISGGRSSANPIYLFLWIMVGWYAFKGDLQSIKNWMKWVIWLSIVAVVFMYLFIGDNSKSAMDVKHLTASFAFLFLIPKTALFFYCSAQLKKTANQLGWALEKKVLLGHDNVIVNGENPNINSNSSSSSIYTNTNSVPFPSSLTSSPTVNDEIYYELALEEFDANRRKGLWVKLLTQNEGDEVKSRFQYIKARAQGIQIEDADQKLKNQPNLIAVKTEAATDDSRKLASSTANNNYKPAVHQEISSLQLKDKLKFTSHKKHDDLYTTLNIGLLNSEKDKFEIKFKFDYQHRSILHIASQVYILTNDENAKYACIGTCTAMNKNDILNFIEYLLEVPIDNANAAADQRKKLLIEKVDRIMNGHALGLTANSENAWMQAIASKNIDAAYKLFNSSIIKSA